MKKLLLVLFVALAIQVQSQNYCDSVEILITNQSLTSVTCSSNTNGLNTFWTSQDWSLTDKYGSVIGTVSGSTATFSMPNPTNSDTNYICLTSILSQPVMTIACNTCDTIVWNGTSWMLLSMMPPPCNLTGGSVYVDHSITPIMMNASVNGMSMYSYSWSNGANANQTAYYSPWCVTIIDLISGCDTTICENCIGDSNNVCPCPMIYMPVCGCDGVQYANDCLAICAGVGWTPAIPSGIPGGFLPCTQSSFCEVEITGDSIICSWVSPQVLTAAPTGNGTPPYTYSWSNGQSNSSILTITMPGTYCVTVIDANGCIATECITVTVQDIPIYSAPSPPIICAGDSIVLEIDTIGLSNIIWVPNTLVTPPVHRIVDFPLPPSQTYVVEAIDSAGCDRRGEIFVTVDSCGGNSSWDCDPSTGCYDPGTGLGAYPTLAACLADSCPGISNFACIGGNAPGITTCVGPGNYAMGQPNVMAVYSTMAACISDSCQNTTAINEEISGLLIYPNPAKNTLTIAGNYTSATIYDIFGKMVLTTYLKKTIDVESLSNGLYFVQISTDNAISVKKIMITK